MTMKVTKQNYLNMILATDNEYGIGRGNDLAWFCKEDLQLFKKKTEGTYIIMGHNTAKSLPNGKPLPNRINVVLCRELPENPITGVIYMHSVEDILEFVEGESAWVIGGAETYKLFIEHCDEIHETDIEGHHNCDVFFDVAEHVTKHQWNIVHPIEFKNTIAQSVTIWSNK